MQDLICPFSSTLLQDDFGCRHASHIVRRGGAEIACSAAPAHARCAQLFQQLKDVALPAFEVADDLLQMPHSVLVKIQYGGLLGLQRHILPDAAQKTGIEDINALIETAIGRYSSLEEIPCNALVEAITSHKLSRRRKRNRE